MIDWFTVVAQIINFFILLWLLKHFLYQHIIDAMDEREQHMQQQSQNIADQKKQLQGEIDSYQQKNTDFAKECQEKQKQVDRELDVYREEQVQEIRNEVAQMQEKWKQSISSEQNTFMQDLRDFLIRETIAISRQTLRDVANEQLEDSIVANFFLQLQQLSKEDYRLLEKSGTPQQNKIVVMSTFEIKDEFRRKIQQILQEKIEEDFVLKFTKSSDLICGIELKLPEHKISWCLQNYLQDFERKVNVALQQEDVTSWKV
ncbi:F0F1 ATP synthase subunit B family protein [Candidatus Uabimicrobium amorphum]|uniref:ATP synthase subunit b n=1 Tax=Uabimicrobium amorphum TaxID=2596890 RepID=A0A5S9F4I5_UABAM|nr:hypothetical protein [Candidatus Uabimicrobium amorphum]BBM85837.1 ATP synthase subunit b 1 [Candidatus Uabimicrobium amorphum]